jgi:hypothetical protein
MYTCSTHSAVLYSHPLLQRKTHPSRSRTIQLIQHFECAKQRAIITDITSPTTLQTLSHVKHPSPVLVPVPHVAPVLLSSFSRVLIEPSLVFWARQDCDSASDSSDELPSPARHPDSIFPAHLHSTTQVQLPSLHPNTLAELRCPRSEASVHLVLPRLARVPHS